jgi:tRNA A-37 threonylcarbamoyl transferase component Bud32
MIDQRLPDQKDPRDDLPETTCSALLDDYWAELQHQSDLDSRRWLSERRLPDQSVEGDLEVLNLLMQLRRFGLAGGDATQDRTLLVPGRFGLGSESEATELDLSGGRGCDPKDEVFQSASQAGAQRRGIEGAASEAVECGPEVDTGPARVGKYLVAELIGQGGQAYVFRVFDPELRQEFALKLARRPTRIDADTDEATPVGRYRVLQEGQLLAQCDHPGLVRIVDFDAHEGRPFVVMEYVTGLTLEQFVDQRRPSSRLAARLTAELAHAVAYLHGLGIVHQDIKPTNVLMDDQGRPRLIDFGLARQQQTLSGDTANVIGGTATCMSPEQALGCADRIGPCTDIFGLGAVLYQMLTQRPLYQGASRESILRQATGVQYIPVRQINRRVPRSLERICHKALAADPERRYGTALALECALRRYLARRRLTMAALAALCSMAVTLIALRMLTPHVCPSSDLGRSHLSGFVR